MARAPRPPRFHSCNVLFDAAAVSRLWTFVGTDVRPAGVIEVPSHEPLPRNLVAKGWAQLARPRLNVVWTGDQPLFLQLVHLPTDDPGEVAGMLELQLEKLSPLPVGQVVWSYEILTQRPPSGLSVLLVLAERSAVETMLTELEGRGYLADRIESPLLTLIAGTNFSRDGAYVFVFRSQANQRCLIGWVADNTLRALNVVNVGDDDRWSRQLLDELHRLAWVGELEGWAAGSAPVHLVADEDTIAEWREALEQGLGAAVTGYVRPSDSALAAASALRAAAGPGSANLLPPERSARYRQESTDRLWMGGLLAVFAAYLVGVLIYLGAVEVQKIRQRRLAAEVAAINTGYTNTLRLKAQAQVLQETVNLRYAALDCWLATVEAMPEELSLDSMAFSGGRQMVISGSVPADQESRISEFWLALKRKEVNNTNLFREVQLQGTSSRTVQGAAHIQWSIVCTLHRTEI